MTFNPGRSPPTTTMAALTSSGLKKRCFLGPERSHRLVRDNKSEGPKLGCSNLYTHTYTKWSNHGWRTQPLAKTPLLQTHFYSSNCPTLGWCWEATPTILDRRPNWTLAQSHMWFPPSSWAPWLTRSHWRSWQPTYWIGSSCAWLERRLPIGWLIAVPQRQQLAKAPSLSWHLMQQHQSSLRQGRPTNRMGWCFISCYFPLK